MADRLLVDGVAEQIVERALAGPELDRLVDAALESPRMMTLGSTSSRAKGWNDDRRRGLHDLIAGTVVVELGDQLTTRRGA